MLSKPTSTRIAQYPSVGRDQMRDVEPENGLH